MKKVFAVLTILVLTFTIAITPVLAAPSFTEKVNSNAVMLVDADSGSVLYSKNADSKIFPASTTKILTALLVIEHVEDLEAKISVGAEVNKFVEGKDSTLHPQLVQYEEISVKDLLYGMLLASGNECAAALAVHVGGSIEEFVNMMNAKAQELGMTSSHFMNPHGRQDEEHYVTASDMSKLASAAMKNEKLMAICSTKTYTIPATNKASSRSIVTTNYLLKAPESGGNTTYAYANGMKTGSTPYAFRCLVASASKDGMDLVVLIFGDQTPTGTERWPLARKLFDFGFNNYTTSTASELFSTIPLSVPVTNAAEGDEGGGVLELTPVLDNTYITIANEDKANAEFTAVLGMESISAPVNQGEVVGKVTYKLGETILATVEVKAARTVLDEASALAQKGRKEPSEYAWIWLIIPAGVIVFLIIRTFISPKRALNKKPTKRRRKY